MAATNPEERVEVRVAPLRPEDVRAVHAAYDRLSPDGKRFFHPGFLGSEPRSVRGIAGRLLLRVSAWRPLLAILQTIRVVPFLIGAVARDQSDVCGFAFILVRRRIGSRRGSYGIFVLGSSEGRGIGGRLTDLVLRRARAIGLREIELTVQVANERARRLYERQGFEVVATVPGGDVYQGNAYDYHRMVLRLSGRQAAHEGATSS